MENFADRIQMLSIQGMPFLVAVVFHEVAHGLMAKRFGDRTAEEAGRLTLNPLPHLDPIGTFLPLAGMLLGTPFLFGWAKPVPIDPRRFSSARPGLFFVALAGPMMNFVLAFVSAAAYCAAVLWLPADSPSQDFFAKAAVASVSVNFALGIFNLLPVPPLDGSKVIESFLPLRAAIRYERLSRYGFAILLLLMFSGALNVLRVPILGATEFSLRWTAGIFESVYEFFLMRFSP